MKCKRCKKRIPQSHKDEWSQHDCLCRKCWHIKNSLYKILKNNESALRKIAGYFIEEEDE